MLTDEDFNDMNIKIPQAISYLVECSTKLLEEVIEITEERDIYKAKYENEVHLRNLQIKGIK